MSILRLQHTRSDGEVDTYHLKSIRRYHIGRGSNCEVRILDLKMSRQHCAIERQGSEWLVHDLGSTNGIKLDGNRIQGSALLTVGSEIRAGGTRLTVSDIDGGDAAAQSELTPVRQEALPAEESDDERPLSESSVDDGDDASLEPQSGVSAPSSGALQAYQRAPSDEFELSDEHKIIGAEAPAGTAPAEPERPSHRPSAVKPLTIQPEPAAPAAADDAPDEDEPAELDFADEPAATAPEPAAPAEVPEPEPAPTPAAASDTAADKSESQKVKPVTIRVGTGRHPAQRDSSSSLYINVMGRRIGPLSRAEAREIKARELKGTLTEAELDKYPGA